MESCNTGRTQGRTYTQHVERGDDDEGQEQGVVVEDGECRCLVLSHL